jgi:predicted Zn-dependent protease with MMP-like domain
MKVSQKEFDKIVKQSIKRIPREFRQYLENILIAVQKRPPRALIKEMGLLPHETLLGLYRGVSLEKRSVTAPPLYPDTIFLFQGPLEELCDTIEEMERQIEKTVVHEVAHYFGISEERLSDLGYG